MEIRPIKYTYHALAYHDRFEIVFVALGNRKLANIILKTRTYFEKKIEQMRTSSPSGISIGDDAADEFAIARDQTEKSWRLKVRPL